MKPRPLFWIVIMMILTRIAVAERKKDEEQTQELSNSTEVTLFNYKMLFKSAGKMLQVAYYSAVAAGHRHTDLQIKTTDLGFKIKRLHEQSIIVMSKSCQSFEIVNRKMAVIFELMNEGYHRIAGKMLAIGHTEDTVNKAITAAHELQTELTKAADESLQLYKEAAIKATGLAEEVNQKPIAEQESLKKQMEFEQQRMKKARKRAAEFRSEKYTLKEKELDELEDTTSIWKNAVNYFTEVLSDKKMFGADKEASETYHKLRVEMEEREQAEIKKMDEAMKNIIKHTSKLASSSTEQELSNAAINALFYTSQALRSLSHVISNIAFIWKVWNMQSQVIVEEHAMIVNIMGMEMPPEQHKELLLDALTEMAKNVATRIDGMIDASKKIKRDLEMEKNSIEESLTSAPTRELAISALPRIAAQMKQIGMETRDGSRKNRRDEL